MRLSVDVAMAHGDDEDNEAVFWAQALALQCSDHRNEVAFIAPWVVQSTGAQRIAGETLATLLGAHAIPTFREIASLRGRFVSLSDERPLEAGDAEGGLRELILQGVKRAGVRMRALNDIAQDAGAMADVDYEFLFDKVRRQLVIGFSVTELRSDASYYDLLASEARLCNFVAIHRESCRRRAGSRSAVY